MSLFNPSKLKCTPMIPPTYPQMIPRQALMKLILLVILFRCMHDILNVIQLPNFNFTTTYFIPVIPNDYQENSNDILAKLVK